MIRGLWEKGTYCILDVRVTHLDAKTHRKKTAEKALSDQEREKKRKYLDACLEQRRHFSPFVVSCDGVRGKEASATLKVLSKRLAEKWDRPYAQVCGFVSARMSITIVRATTMCLRGSRVPAKLMSRSRAQFDDGAGIAIHGY
jgi:hypothetical protein